MPPLLAAAVLLGQVQIAIDAKRLNPSGPMDVRFTIENAGAAPAEVDEPRDWLAGLEIRDSADKVIRDAAKSEPARRVRLDARCFFGRVVDIAPALAGKPSGEGMLKLTWKHAGLESPPLAVLLMREYRVRIETNLGDLVIECFTETAPKNVLHFMTLAREGFYDGKTFHRVIPGLLMQGGNAKPDGSGEDPRRIKGEFGGGRKHEFGVVAMARQRDDPDSASTEFYVCFAPIPWMDGHDTIFGRVIEGDGALRDAEKARTDHSPCRGCGQPLEAKFDGRHCGVHHRDRPEIDIVMKKVTVFERKD